MAGGWQVLLAALALGAANFSWLKDGVLSLTATCAPAGQAGAGTLCEQLEWLSAHVPGVARVLRESNARVESTRLAQEQKQLMVEESRRLQAARAEANARTCEVFLGIISRPEAGAAREAMRQTWLQPVIQQEAEERGGGARGPLSGVQYKFFIGRPAGAGPTWAGAADAGRGDVVELPFIDTYYNLSVKTAHVLRWPEVHDLGCRWVVKVDDDVYVHVPALLRTLASLPDPDWPVYAGHILTAQAPVRDPSSKWHLPADAYRPEAFPPYAEGPLYVLSAGLAQDLPYTLLTTPQGEVVPSTLLESGPRSSLFRFEDVFTGELIRRLPYSPALAHLPRIYVHANHTKASGAADDESDKDADGSSKDPSPDDDASTTIITTTTTTTTTRKRSSSAKGAGRKAKKLVAQDGAPPQEDEEPAGFSTVVKAEEGAAVGGTGEGEKEEEAAAVHGLTPEGMRAVHRAVGRTGAIVTHDERRSRRRTGRRLHDRVA